MSVNTQKLAITFLAKQDSHTLLVGKIIWQHMTKGDPAILYLGLHLKEIGKEKFTHTVIHSHTQLFIVASVTWKHRCLH